METYCVKYSKKTEYLNSKVFKTKDGRLVMQSNCIKCGFKKSRFAKKQEGKGIKTPLSKIRLSNVLF